MSVGVHNSQKGNIMTIYEWLERNQTALEKKPSALVVHTQSTWHIGTYRSQSTSRLVITKANGSDVRILLASINGVKRITRSSLSKLLQEVCDSSAIIFEGPVPQLKKTVRMTSAEMCEVLSQLDSLPNVRLGDFGLYVFLTQR